jgi:hypothetical protein
MYQRFHTCDPNNWAECVSPIREPHYVYPGTQCDLRGLAIPCWTSGDPLYDAATIMGYPLLLLDLPLSLVADTVFLPYDIFMVTAGGKTRYRKDIRQSSKYREAIKRYCEQSMEANGKGDQQTSAGDSSTRGAALGTPKK